MQRNRILIVLGDQLFPLEFLSKTKCRRIFMAEDLGLCTASKHHKLKILMFLSAMRAYRDALVKRGFEVFAFLGTHWRRGVIGGLCNFISYGIAIWALTFTAMANVSALRETSVVIAALIGSRVLGEAFGRKRLISAVTVFVGVLMINFSAV